MPGHATPGPGASSPPASYPSASDRTASGLTRPGPPASFPAPPNHTASGPTPPGPAAPYPADHAASAPGTPDSPVSDPAEVELVHRLRSDSGWIPTLSLVAQLHEQVVGHVCLTRAGIGPFPVLALGPVGVLPEHQHRGFGSALIHAALGAADALDEPLVGLLGSLEYYARFGFVPAARLGIVPDEPAWTSHFQVRTLTAYEPQILGEFHYADPFYTM